jgi:phospholipid transport system substrate-binding protein
MTIVKKILGLAGFCIALMGSGFAQAQEAPDALIKRISTEVLETAKTDKEIQRGNMQSVLKLVEEKVLPHVNFQRMTALAVGRPWREATPEQRQRLTEEFRDLLVYTYSGAIAQVKDERIEFLPSRSTPEDKDVEVRTQIIPSRGEPLPLQYRLHQTQDGWKIYDVNVLGAWLVQTYRGNFNTEISRNGIDGLIKSLDERNKRLAASAADSAAGKR